MDVKEILKLCFEKGLLLDKEVLNLFNETNDLESVKYIIENIKDYTHERIITKNTFKNNPDNVSKVFLTLPEENQKKLETLKIKLGLSIQISKETEVENTKIPIEIIIPDEKVKILSSSPLINKKLEVDDFVKHFRGRFYDMKNFLQERSDLVNLTSINKINDHRKKISIIGIVFDKKTTKNKNIILDVEDVTGKVRVLVSNSRQETYQKAEEVALDSVIGIIGVGNGEVIFANDIIFPDSSLLERKNSPIDESVCFTGDLHFGSKKFLEDDFLSFIDYLNKKTPHTPEVDKIKYLFIGGDVVTGIGNYPNQERDLKITDLEEQFLGVADFFRRVRKDIKIIISPGNHDGVRLMEPQPIFDEKYAWPLYNLKNIILTENPALVNIGSTKNFSGFDILTYHGFSLPFFASSISKLIAEKAANSPEKIMSYLLKNRHLAPTHASTQYFPHEKDTHIIKTAPDIFFAAHLHKSAISYHNNILIISSSSWESKTDYQEKFGNEPDYCKVPLFNLKTRAIKILDFEQ
ncbi:MAG: metallophosphoesterase [Nanoarchaeota archaeon]